MALYRLHWKGPLLVSKAKAASSAALVKTAARCVTKAKTLVRVKTATLQGSLRFTPPQVKGKGVTIQWGSFDVNYAIFQELGTYKMSAKPYLRPAADEYYPQLEDLIRQEMVL